MRRIISVLLENESGALSRVIGLFAQRGYNIETLTVAPTDDETLSRLTLTTLATDEQIEQITKHLNKLIEVVKLVDLTEGEYVAPGYCDQTPDAPECAFWCQSFSPRLFFRLQVLIQIALLIWVSLLQSVQDGCTPILGWLCLAPAVAVLILEWLCSFFGTLGIACLFCSPTV